MPPEAPMSHQSHDDVELSLSPRQLSDAEDDLTPTELSTKSGQSPNATSLGETVADDHNTNQVINRHPAASAKNVAFRIGVATDKNKKCRRTMEDAHAFMYDFANVRGQGYFAIFDGHAGKHAAEWCGRHFHEYLLKEMENAQGTPIPDCLNTTFHTVDAQLSKLAAEDGTHSGCTAVTAFLRLEDKDGHGATPDDIEPVELDPMESKDSLASASTLSSVEEDSPLNKDSDQRKRFGDGVHREKIKEFFSSSSASSSRSSTFNSATGATSSTSRSNQSPAIAREASTKKFRRTLYTANVGDARAVLCRGGKAVRLTYDHKGSDAQEAKRITDAGGFVMNNRVNGVLAVTRSLGDSSMKEFVVGSPYTTETTLSEEDEFLIVACDGLWDVCEDQEAVDLIRENKLQNAQEAAKALLEFALGRFSSDNLSILVVTL